MKLIVGLGNPGKEYLNTRHNVGFMYLDYIFDNKFVFNKRFNAMEYIFSKNGEKIIVIKPYTFMNFSGDEVIKYVNYYKIDISSVLVIQDDLDMPVGKIKLLYNHGDGGHNGIKSIVNSLNGKAFLRLKIGISKSSDIDTKDFVLGIFNNDELEKVKNSFKKLSSFIDDFIDFKNRDLLISKYNSKL